VLALGGLAVLLVVVVAVIALSSGGGSPAPSPGASTPTTKATTSAQRRSVTPAPPHNRTTVAVLNGTSVAGLANTVANKLKADGFVNGTITNASSPDRTVTIVSYFGGHEREAQEVAKSLGLPLDAVQAIDSDTEASACQGAPTCAATVVVVVGADQQ
jgi:ABC-type uncharacterized transport system permease subunit